MLTLADVRKLKANCRLEDQPIYDTAEAALLVVEAAKNLVEKLKHLSTGYDAHCLHCKLSDSLDPFQRGEDK